jgi:O-acetyl-ADP-ribose deacetylase (regulator of RNase III)
MIRFTQGNLLEAPTEALVNTVNTVGVMGKGIALMFKDAFPENYRLYREACKTKNVKIGRVFATERRDFVSGPRWIINFPTKEHWRAPSRIEWIRDGLVDLRRFIKEHKIRSVALPPLGSGNGGLEWREVRPLIVQVLEPLQDVTTIVYEPTKQYQNVQKREGIERLTPARALLTELVRRYWVLGIECTMLEVQKLAYFLERQIDIRGLPNPLNLAFGLIASGHSRLSSGICSTLSTAAICIVISASPMPVPWT